MAEYDASDINLILAKLEDIQKSIAGMAVQDNRLDALEAGHKTLWLKYDNALGPDGTLTKVKDNQVLLLAKQESCQVKSLAFQMRIIWVALLGMATSIIFKFIHG